jgi:hypothetical protein
MSQVQQQQWVAQPTTKCDNKEKCCVLLNHVHTHPADGGPGQSPYHHTHMAAHNTRQLPHLVTDLCIISDGRYFQLSPMNSKTLVVEAN